jgi:putative ABC transport system substrate-binding protein
MELFKEAIPRLARVAVLGNLANPAHTQRLKGTDGAARSMHLQLQILWARGPNEFESAFRAMVSAGAHGLLVLHDAMFWSHRRQLADLAATHHMPTMFQWREHVDAGGLMAYGANIPDLARRAATFVDKILRGAKPADLPAEQPTKFELVINLKTAKALGLTIPPSLLLRADEVIE